MEKNLLTVVENISLKKWYVSHLEIFYDWKINLSPVRINFPLFSLRSVGVFVYMVTFFNQI